jgi:hypothetical protein
MSSTLSVLRVPRLTIYDIAFVLVQIGDALTMLMLPHGSETNPIAITSPELSVIAKMLVILLVINGSFGKYERLVVLIGLVVGSIGLGANLSVLV